MLVATIGSNVGSGALALVGLHGRMQGGAVTVDFDATLLIQAAIFIILIAVLKPLLFDPMLKLYEKREQQTDELRGKIGGILQTAAEHRTNYETKMAAAQTEARKTLEKFRSEGQRTEADMLAKVRGEVEARLDDGRRKNDAEAMAVRAVLDAEVAGIAESLAARAVGREV